MPQKSPGSVLWLCLLWHVVHFASVIIRVTVATGWTLLYSQQLPVISKTPNHREMPPRDYRMKSNHSGGHKWEQNVLLHSVKSRVVIKTHLKMTWKLLCIDSNVCGRKKKLHWKDWDKGGSLGPHPPRMHLYPLVGRKEWHRGEVSLFRGKILDVPKIRHFPLNI